MKFDGTHNQREHPPIIGLIDVYKWRYKTIARKWPTQTSAMIRAGTKQQNEAVRRMHQWLRNAPAQWLEGWRHCNLPTGRTYRDLYYRTALSISKNHPTWPSFFWSSANLQPSSSSSLISLTPSCGASFPISETSFRIRTHRHSPRAWTYVHTSTSHPKPSSPCPPYSINFPPLWEPVAVYSYDPRTGQIILYVNRSLTWVMVVPTFPDPRDITLPLAPPITLTYP